MLALEAIAQAQLGPKPLVTSAQITQQSCVGRHCLHIDRAWVSPAPRNEMSLVRHFCAHSDHSGGAQLQRGSQNQPETCVLASCFCLLEGRALWAAGEHVRHVCTKLTAVLCESNLPNSNLISLLRAMAL